MPDYDYPTPDDSNDWCNIVIEFPTALRPHLMDVLRKFFNEFDWLQVGDMTPLVASDLIESAWQGIQLDCGVFLHDESEIILTDDSGAILEAE